MSSQTTPPTFTENPAPRQAYRLTLRIEGAPGPLEVVSSAAQYDVVNPECLPPPKDNPGGHTSAVPTHDIPVRLQRVSDNEYAGVFHADGMVDADYHGRGVCRWQLIQAQVQLQESVSSLEQELATLKARFPGLRERITASRKSIVVVEETMFKGVVVTFGTLEYQVPEAGVRKMILKAREGLIIEAGFNFHERPILDFNALVDETSAAQAPLDQATADGAATGQKADQAAADGTGAPA